LSDLAGEDGTWLPNGDLLVSHENHLWVVPKVGGAPRKFADTGGLSWWFRWSPDGKALRFTKNETGPNGNHQWEISADGTNSHRVLADWQEQGVMVRGNWTPDGKYFVFTVLGRAHDDLWALREKGDWLHKLDRKPVQLTSGPLGFSSSQPSLDGRKIFAIGTQFRSELSRYDKKSRQFVPYLGGISAVGVTFSPDGQWVAYITFPEGQLWRSRLDGSEKLQLTFPPNFSAYAQWSPDGQQIAFDSSLPGAPEQLCVVGKDGGSPRVLYQGQDIVRPSWRRDANTILFEDNLGVPEEAVVQLFKLKTNQLSTLPGSKGLVLPVVSPNGRYLAAGTVDGKKLKVYDFEAQAWQDFTSEHRVGFTVWSADSAYIYFDNGLSADPAIYRLRVADHMMEQVASLKNLRRVAWRNLPWLGLVPNGDPLVMRDVGSQEVYALDFDEP
jgi:Tol biopolymer transport system component